MGRPAGAGKAGFGDAGVGLLLRLDYHARRKREGRRSCYRDEMSAASGLDGLLEPLSRCLDVESARRVVDFQIDAPVQERIDALAAQANEGALSDSERSEYEALINAADFISILKLKARLHLDTKIQ